MFYYIYYIVLCYRLSDRMWR